MLNDAKQGITETFILNADGGAIVGIVKKVSNYD